MNAEGQLDLPFPGAGVAEAGRPAGDGAQATFKAAGSALTLAAAPIPARCPVTGARTCYRDGCMHYTASTAGAARTPRP